ncbi:MAG: BA14K family protein [Pseudomonadota bacterium]
MKKIATLFAIGLGFAVAANDFQPVQAATLNIGPVYTGEGPVVEVQRRRIRRGRPGRRYYGRRRGGNAGAVLGGIVAGAIIAGAINESRRARARRAPRRVYRGNAHTNWCYSRYRSYRAYDNTYQPYSGRRRACISPYY